MTTAKFFAKNNLIYKFEISGHSGFSKTFENDIVCASISSCAYMVANTITDIYFFEAEIEVDEESGFLAVAISPENAKQCKELLEGFKLHLTELSKQFSKNVSVKTINT